MTICRTKESQLAPICAPLQVHAPPADCFIGLESLTGLGVGALVIGVVTTRKAWKHVAAAVAAVVLVFLLFWARSANATPHLDIASRRQALVAAAQTHGEDAGAADAGRSELASGPSRALDAAWPAPSESESFDRAQTAAAWGVTDLGLLDTQGKAAAVATLTREDAGRIQEAGELDFVADPAHGWLLITNQLKCEIVLRMLDEGRYLTVPPGTMPKVVPPGADPMILLTGVRTGAGETRGVIFPVEIVPGSPFAWARANQIAARDAMRDASTIGAISEFNALTLVERTRRVDEMAAAQDAIDYLMRAQARGEITHQQFFERAVPLAGRQPPSGTALDRTQKLLRRR